MCRLPSAGSGALCVALVAGATPAASAGDHGISIFNVCGDAKVGDPLPCLGSVGHLDAYGDTTRIVAAWLILDPLGAALRVPEVGNLPFAVNGNAYSPDGDYPVLMGPANSLLSGLPGAEEAGLVDFASGPSFLLPDGLPDPLTVRLHVVVEDVCDNPATQGCSPLPTAVEFPASLDIIHPLLDLVSTASPSEACAEGGTMVTLTHVLTNVGDVDLQFVTVTDDLCGLLPGPLAGGDGDDVLGIGESWTFQCGQPMAGPATLAVSAAAVDTVLNCPAVAETTVLISEGPCVERPHPGWNRVDVARDWTGNQPAYWSALSGAPGPGGAALPPFTVLDPADVPGQEGRPATDGSDDRVLRGFVYAWAVDADGYEISWNHLGGGATLVNYRDGTAWSYGAWAFQDAAGLDAGTPLVQDGVLELDGAEYAPAYDLLLLDFVAPFSGALGNQGGPLGAVSSVDTHLALHAVSADLRQETDGPLSTKATFVIWNEDETQFTNLHRCITCWDGQLLSLYAEGGVQNHFLGLQTDKGTARIDGVASELCASSCCLDRGAAAGCGDAACQAQVCAVDPACCTAAWDLQCAREAVELCDACESLQADLALLGVAAKQVTITNAAGARHHAAGTNLVGMGTQSALVLYDPQDGGSPPAATGPPAGGAADRVSGTEKGSLLVYSRVELRWDQAGGLVQDTFIDLVNDHGAPVRVKLYFVNGDPPLEGGPE